MGTHYQDITKVIEFLLYEQECVVVPTLGGFITRTQPSSIDYVQGIIFPGSKVLTFNKNLSQSDGLLAHSVAKKSHISYQEADQRVLDFAQAVIGKLDKNEVVILENIGKLFLNPEKNIQFISYEKNYSLQEYGLPKLNFYPILRQNSYVPVVEPPKAKAPASASIQYTSIKKLAVAAAVLLLLGVGTWRLSHRPTHIENASIVNQPSSPTEKTQKEKDTDTEDTTVPQNAIHNDVPVVMQAESAADNETQPENNVEDNKTLSASENKKMLQKYLAEEEDGKAYVIILGSFGTDKNAKAYSKKLMKDGYTPYSDKLNSLSRVGVRLNCSTTELEKHLSRLRQKYNKAAWVLER